MENIITPNTTPQELQAIIASLQQQAAQVQPIAPAMPYPTQPQAAPTTNAFGQVVSPVTSGQGTAWQSVSIPVNYVTEKGNCEVLFTFPQQALPTFESVAAMLKAWIQQGVPVKTWGGNNQKSQFSAK